MGLIMAKGNVRTSLPKPSSLHAKGGRVVAVIFFFLAFLNACLQPLTVWYCASSDRSFLRHIFKHQELLSLRQPVLVIASFLPSLS